MDEKNGQHFKVECQIDGKWFGDNFVFPDRTTALEFKRRVESRGSVNQYRIVGTDSPVNLPTIGEDEDGLSDEDDPSSLIDWSTLFDLSILCPATLRGSGDGDLDRVHSQCQCGYVEGEVFI